MAIPSICLTPQSKREATGLTTRSKVASFISADHPTCIADATSETFRCGRQSEQLIANLLRRSEALEMDLQPTGAGMSCIEIGYCPNSEMSPDFLWCSRLLTCCAERCQRVDSCLSAPVATSLVYISLFIYRDRVLARGLDFRWPPSAQQVKDLLRRRGPAGQLLPQRTVATSFFMYRERVLA
jgi:hypothetical protein